MARIRVLDPHVVNQIAAGEVIERPASVVKELVENALDAGATLVEVRIEDGGRALIEVADDGCGMDAEDLARAFLPHATSKISDVGDLEHVASLGFRGEALASIGSVSRASIVSRPRDAATGHVVEDRDGTVTPVRPAGARPGTVVRVEGLFHGVPARRKFLRTAATETGHVADLLGRFAVAHPEVAFRLIQGDRTLLATGRSEDRRARIARVHGEEVARDLLAVAAEAGGIALEAHVGPPSLTRSDARLEQTFLNGRHVRDRTIAHALKEAYRDLVPPGGRRPVAFLFLRVDPALVDVNVHPAKAEVRWRDPSAVHTLVQRALRRVLEGAAPGVPIPVGPGGGKENLRPATVAAAEFAFTHGVGRPTPGFVGDRAPGSFPSAADLSSGGTPAGSAWADRGGAPGTEPGGRAAVPVAGPPGTGGPPTRGGLRPIGQALGTYLVLEGADEIVLVDQHALHERILFDRINARLRTAGRLEVQHLLVPHVAHVGPAAAAVLGESGELLAALGWVVEPFGEGAVAVRGLPAVLRRPDPEAALAEVLGLLEAGREAGLDRAALVSAAVDRLACRAAVMAGDPLAPEEVLALLEQAEALDHAHSCPHGRPTRLVLSAAALEKWFHRTV